MKFRKENSIIKGGELKEGQFRYVSKGLSKSCRFLVRLIRPCDVDKSCWRTKTVNKEDFHYYGDYPTFYGWRFE